MRKVENLGVIKTKHTSGIAQSDKGNKFPDSRCEIGDVMLSVDGKRVIVPKEIYNKEYRADALKFEKSKKETQERDKEKQKENRENIFQENKALKFENEKLNMQLKAAKAEIVKLKDDLNVSEAQIASRLVDDITKEEEEKQDA